MIFKILRYEIEININKIKNPTVEDMLTDIKYELRDDYKGEIQVTFIIPTRLVNELKDSFQRDYEYCTNKKVNQTWYEFKVEPCGFRKVRFTTSNAS